MESLVKLQQIGKTYLLGVEEVPALLGIDLDVGRGEYVAIMGHSGSGKSTLLNILGCLDKPSFGDYYLGARNVATMSDDQLSEVRNLQIGFIFQSFNLIAELSILENIEVPLFYQGMPRRDRRRRSSELANLVGLGHRMFHKPKQLSGGQQQRVAIARALANDPLILLADEPTGNLDSVTTEDILSIFAQIHDQGRTIIMITHEDDVSRHAHRIVHLRDGRIDSDRQNIKPTIPAPRRPAEVPS